MTLKNWLTSGINQAGMTVLDLGLVPTPTSYFSNFVKSEKKEISASIMITGSHNPPEYNGFKITLNKKPFFGEQIYALGKKVLSSNQAIEDNVNSLKIATKQRYINYMIKEFEDLKFTDKKFVFDCGNGVAGTVLREILVGIKIKHKIIYETPDGNFPNHHPDPSDEKNLKDLKKELKTDEFALGFAYDGDADRLAVLSKNYNFKGDILAIFFAKFIENPIVIGEVKCSQIMYDKINLSGKAIMHKTGHSNLKVKIKETKADFAAEVSGHLFFNDKYFGYDDAIYATLRTLELLYQGFDFDKEFEKLPKLYSTDEINIKTTEEEKFKLIENLEKKLKNPPKNFPKIIDIILIDGIRVVFENGWGLIRASNTTPNLVTRFEGKNEKKALLYQAKLLELLNY